jgi:peptidoglycan/xylan/chitin deacetylase (PgdA/CDA1 family)
VAPLYDQEQTQVALPPEAPAPAGTSAVFVRRRAVALGVAVGLLFVVIALARGDGSSPFGPASEGTLTAAEAAKLPWRQRYASGSAGPLDARGLPSPAAQREAVRRFYRLGLPIYCGGGRGNYVALTFDDGPSQYSEQVLRLLRQANVQATFFLVGQVVGEHPEIPRQQVELGGVADHTWTHPMLTRLGQRDLQSELRRTQTTLEQATGEPVTLMRPPYGSRDARVDRAVHRLRMLPVMWDSDSRDSAGESSEAIVTNAVEGMRPGGIILMHETYDRSLAALPQVLVAARQKGIRLVSVPQMLALDPPTEAQLRAGGEGCSERERFQAEKDGTAMRLAS